MNPWGAPLRCGEFTEGDPLSVDLCGGAAQCVTQEGANSAGVLDAFDSDAPSTKRMARGI